MLSLQVWKDEQQRAAYFAQSRAVYLLTPPSTQPVVALPRKADRPRGTGVPESAALPASPAVLLQQLRRGVEARLSSLPGRRLVPRRHNVMTLRGWGYSSAKFNTAHRDSQNNNCCHHSCIR